MDGFDIGSVDSPATRLSGVTDLGSLLTQGGFSIIDFVFFMVGVFFLGSLLVASLRYIGSEGDSKKISDATHRITNSILGIIIVFASFVIVRIAASIFGYGSIVPFGR